MADLAILALLGLVAGTLTTVAGLGGGLMLVSVLALMRGPLEALTLTAPALLLGNVHRVWMFHSAIDRSVAVPLVTGAGIGAFVGALLVVGLAPAFVQSLIVLVTLYAVAKEAGYVDFRPSGRWLFPTALGVGVIASGSGAAVVVAPVLVAGGLVGEAFVATGAAVAIAIHSGRIAAFGMEGALDANGLMQSAVLAAMILTGNIAGRSLRVKLGEPMCRKVTMVALVGSVIAGIAGFVTR